VEKSARLRNSLIAVIFSLQGLIFSATMPKAKNQSRRVYCFLWGFPPQFFCFFFLKKEEWGISVVFASFSEKEGFHWTSVHKLYKYV